MELTNQQMALIAATNMVSSGVTKRNVVVLADEYLLWLRRNS